MDRNCCINPLQTAKTALKYLRVAELAQMLVGHDKCDYYKIFGIIRKSGIECVLSKTRPKRAIFSFDAVKPATFELFFFYNFLTKNSKSGKML